MILSTYSRRIGKIRYWTIIAIPLIYFLFPFETYFLNLFQPLVVSSPVSFGIVNISVFSATKQIGALLFSLSFLNCFCFGFKACNSKVLVDLCYWYGNTFWFYRNRLNIICYISTFWACNNLIHADRIIFVIYWSFSFCNSCGLRYRTAKGIL